MSNYSFNQDLLIGNEGEDLVIKDLSENGIVLVSRNDDYRYDLLMEKNDKRATYEVKTDIFCTKEKDTGNIFVEYECRGKPSGILTTEAKWFVTYFKNLNELWYIKNDDLFKLIVENLIGSTKNSGDFGSNTKGFLVPKKQHKDKFRIKQLD